MRLAIGCPITNRAWILPTWFNYLDVATTALDGDITFYFVCGTSKDDTEDILLAEMQKRNIVIHLEDESPEQGQSRKWGEPRYRQLVDLRNMLLELVRADKPDLFLSIDSDILLHGSALDNLLESIQTFDAVGGKVYLQSPPSKAAPNYAMLNKGNGNLRRPDHSGVFRADVIMALKLMTPVAYNVDYEYHHFGEDIGWSLACHDRGLTLGFDGRIPSKHVRKPTELKVVDNRVGY